MEAIYLLFAFAITFGAGTFCGYAFRSVIAKDVAEAKQVIQEAKQLLAEVKSKV